MFIKNNIKNTLLGIVIISIFLMNTLNAQSLEPNFIGDFSQQEKLELKPSLAEDSFLCLYYHQYVKKIQFLNAIRCPEIQMNPVVTGKM